MDLDNLVQFHRPSFREMRRSQGEGSYPGMRVRGWRQISRG